MNVPSIRYCTFGLALVLAALSPSLAFASGETVSTGNLGDLPPGVMVKIFFSTTVDAGLPVTDNQAFPLVPKLQFGYEAEEPGRKKIP